MSVVSHTGRLLYTMMREDGEDEDWIVENVPCPACGMAAGHPCIKHVCGKSDPTRPHMRRRYLAFDLWAARYDGGRV